MNVNPQGRLVWVAAALLLVMAGYGGFRLGRQAAPAETGMAAGQARAGAGQPASAAGSAPAAADAMGAAVSAAPAAASARVLYWYDPMKPDQHFDNPGKSPFMDMELVPRYAEAPAREQGLSISTAATSRLGVRLAAVERSVLAPAITVPVSVQFNDRQVAVVQARAAAFVERAWPHAPGDVVAAGAPLVELLLPDWAGAQSEYLAVLKTGDAALADAARARLQLLGMSAALIARVAAAGQAEATQVITAPIAGVIQSLDVRAGMTVAAGANLVRINGLGSVWLEAAVPEAQAGLLAPGMALSATFPGLPGSTFRARVQSLLPEANADAHTVRVRAELPAAGRLRPGMFGTAQLTPPAQAATLQVPSEAVIRTGTRDLVIVAGKDGRYVPVEVRLGTESGERIGILAGLHEGEQVVASGQFLIDSEASLKGVMARLAPAGNAP
ncbi:MAG: efflux RND transporter periplasmic adaptor subunit [Pseudomonadota bacterium]|nr:efflux RND transporter periplasmic adaptor subunit [Pseudomonadota bacterium]